MKVVILAGGRGTRLSEETDMRPKPMVEIGGQPIVWHIMKTFGHHGLNFVANLVNVMHAVVDEINLPLAVELAQDGVADELRIEADDARLDGEASLRRRL